MSLKSKKPKYRRRGDRLIVTYPNGQRYLYAPHGQRRLIVELSRPGEQYAVTYSETGRFALWNGNCELGPTQPVRGGGAFGKIIAIRGLTITHGCLSKTKRRLVEAGLCRSPTPASRTLRCWHQHTSARSTRNRQPSSMFPAFCTAPRMSWKSGIAPATPRCAISNSDLSPGSPGRQRPPRREHHPPSPHKLRRHAGCCRRPAVA